MIRNSIVPVFLALATGCGGTPSPEDIAQTTSGLASACGRIRQYRFNPSTAAMGESTGTSKGAAIDNGIKAAIEKAAAATISCPGCEVGHGCQPVAQLVSAGGAQLNAGAVCRPHLRGGGWKCIADNVVIPRGAAKPTVMAGCTTCKVCSDGECWDCDGTWLGIRTGARLAIFGPTGAIPPPPPPFESDDVLTDQLQELEDAYRDALREAGLTEEQIENELDDQND